MANTLEEHLSKHFSGEPDVDYAANNSTPFFLPTIEDFGLKGIYTEPSKIVKTIVDYYEAREWKNKAAKTGDLHFSNQFIEIGVNVSYSYDNKGHLLVTVMNHTELQNKLYGERK